MALVAQYFFTASMEWVTRMTVLVGSFLISAKVVAFALERLVAYGEAPRRAPECRPCALMATEKARHLHAGGVVLELLIHEVLKLGELHDVVVHRVDLRTGEAEQSAVQIYVLTAGQLWVEANAEFDERHQLALDGNRALLRCVNLGDDLQQG